MKFSFTTKMATLVTLSLSVIGCGSLPSSEKIAEVEKRTANQSLPQFRNLVSLEGIPDAANTNGISVLLDQGSWHGHGLGDEASLSFSGPFLLTRNNGYWLSQNALTLHLGDRTPSCSLNSKYSMPGRLVSKGKCGPLSYSSELIITSGRSSLQRTILTNNGDSLVNLSPSWRTDTLFGKIEFSQPDNNSSIIGRFTDSEAIVITEALDGGVYSHENSSLTIDIKSGALKPGEQKSFYILQSAYFNEGDRSEWSETTIPLIKSPDTAFATNAERWDNYISSIDEMLGSQKDDPVARKLAVKSVQTLIGNWRSPAGDLMHNGVIPSYAVRYFHGFWAWDSWKHAAALSRFAPELAKDQMRAMFDYQDERGMVADVIYTDKSENNWRDTKPPLSVWAVSEIYKSDGDIAFVREMMPALLSYHQWWYKDRDHDEDRLAEYGSTDGTRIAAAWESGMDNAVRFDNATMVQNNPHAWSLTQESVDLNAYLALEKNLLADLLEALEETIKAEEFRQEATILEARIRELNYSQSTGYFHDNHISTDELITVQGPEGWTPLWTGMATAEQAENVRHVMIKPTKFDTYLPFPTLAADHPDFDPTNGYWRGPVWFDQAYFGISGLRRYGYHEDADRLMTKLFKNAEGLLLTKPIHENYHPLTGEGLNAGHFSWSAAHILLMLEEAGNTE